MANPKPTFIYIAVEGQIAIALVAMVAVLAHGWL
jgi:hypothetical protein